MLTTSSVDPDQLADHIASMCRDDASFGVVIANGLVNLSADGAYGFASDRAQHTSDKYGAQTIELLAVKPTQETSK